MRNNFDRTAPAVSAVAVTTSDDNDLTNGMCRALFIGVGGNVVLHVGDTASGVTFKNIPSGTVLPVQATRVLATNTTATDIVALY